MWRDTAWRCGSWLGLGWEKRDTFAGKGAAKGLVEKTLPGL